MCVDIMSPSSWSLKSLLLPILAVVQCVQGTPTLTVNGVLLSQHNATLLLVDIVSAGHSSGYMHLACHSAVATPAYTWYYCYGGSEQRMMSTASARLSLPVDSAQTGVYTCVVPRDGFVSVSIYHEDQAMGLSCDSDHSTASSTNDSSGSGELINGGAQLVDDGADSVEGPHRAEWMVVSIAGGAGVFVVVVLVITAVLVTVCIHRRYRGQADNYAVMEDIGVSSFQSIPYTLNEMPECPILICHEMTELPSKTSHSKKKVVMAAGRRRMSALTLSSPSPSPASRWSQSSSRCSYSAPPSMTWYYSAGRPVPPPSSSDDDDGLDEDDDCRPLMKQRSEVRGGGQCRERGRTEGLCGAAVIGGAVDVGQFEDHIRSKYEDGMRPFREEFTCLYSGAGRPMSIALRLENRTKNRHATICPYDDQRVILQSSPPRSNISGQGDYINASYIHGFSTPNKFIATQAPLPHTVVDFWRLVWQERASCLVLLTQHQEGGCGKPGERYCPDQHGTWCMGPFLVTTTCKTQCAHHTLRSISLQVSGCAPLEVCHLHFTGWSGHDSPPTASALLAFHRRYTEITRTASHPTVVHCSTGAGLSGVFIAVDCVLSQVAEQGKVDVWGAVNSLRQHRPRMVLTLEQYRLIHEVVVECVRWGCTEMPVCELAHTLTAWQQGEREGEENDSTGLEKMLQTVENEVRVTPAPVVVRTERQSSCSSHPLSIVYTAPGRGTHNVKPVRYLHHRLTTITGYWQESVFLAMPSPTHTSAAQLWRAVLNSRCSTIVALSQPGETSYQYWPIDTGAFTAGQYSVQLVNGGEGDGEGDGGVESVKRTFRVTHCVSGKSHLVSQFHVLDWTGDLPSLRGVVKAVLAAQSTSRHAPLLLHCSDGVSVCGVVCAVMVAVEQGQVEGLVDIPHTVRRIRAQLPTAVSTKAQLKLVFEAVTMILTRQNKQ